MKSLTDDLFWKNFWKKKTKIHIVGENYYFSKVLKDISAQISANKSFIEIGGFPGNYSVYAKKYLGFKSTLVDLYIDKKQISETLKANGLDVNSIKTIKGNIFDIGLIKDKYGIVFSSGFIEHFNNIEKVIKRHLDLCADNGYVVISIPNFLGLNGYFQKMFDPGNLSVHNLQSMDRNYLTKILNRMKIKNFSVSYYGHFSLWLERLESRNIILKIIVYLSVLIRPIFAIFGINNKLFSPLVLILIKNEK
jgi:SAM-dependent methyltransferase